MLIGCLLHSGGNCGGPIGKNGRWEAGMVKEIICVEGVDSAELIDWEEKERRDNKRWTGKGREKETKRRELEDTLKIKRELFWWLMLLT
jgi:hypothetical protein